MLVGPEYFPTMRAAQEAVLVQALERRRIAEERTPGRSHRPARRLLTVLSHSRKQVEECCAQLDEAGSAWQAGAHRA